MGTTTETRSILIRVLGAAGVGRDLRTIQTGTQNLNRNIMALKAGLMGMQSGLLGLGSVFAIVGLGLRSAIRSYSDYTAAQGRLRATLASTGAEYVANSRMVGNAAESAAIRYGYSLVEATDAMDTLVQTGMDLEPAMRMYESTLRLARAGAMETSEATEFLTDTMNMFRGEMQGRELREFADIMSGQLVIAANMTSTSVTQLRQSFKYAGTELAQLGYSSREVIAVASGLSSVGIRGTSAGTRIRQMMSQMIDPSQRARRHIDQLIGRTGAWAEITHTASGELRRLPDMMNQMMQLFARLETPQERAQLQFELFGVRAFAAGASMADFNVAGQRMVAVNERLADTGASIAAVTRAEQARLRSFDIQLNNARESINDFGIAFGEIFFGQMSMGEEGFGTYLRQVARGIRIITEMEGGNRANVNEFNELSSGVREAARDLHEFFVNASSVVRVLANVIRVMGRFTSQHPYFVGGLLAMRASVGGFLPFLGRLLSGAGGAAGAGAVDPNFIGPQPLSTGARVAGATGPLGMAGGAAAGVLIVSALGPPIRDLGLTILGLEGDLAILRRSAGNVSTAFDRIPVIGPVISLFIDAVTGAVNLIRENNRVAARRERYAEQTTFAPAATVLRDLTASTPQRVLETEEEYSTRVRNRARQESMMRGSLLLWGQNLRTQSQIETYLQQHGVSVRESSEMAAEYVLQQRLVGGDMQRQVNEIAPHGTSATAMRQYLNQIMELTRGTETLNRAIEGLATPPSTSPQSQRPVVDTWEVQDAYVRRGGLVSVASGDMVVSRNRLASGIRSNEGGMVGPMLGGASAGGAMVGPSLSASSGGGGEFVITVPVIIDGREIARANGRANIRQLERGGGRLPPGQRRSLRETGFNRVV
jgi:TP901 family phage tail tape measure protein